MKNTNDMLSDATSENIVALAKNMLSKKTSFLEGAAQMQLLRSQLHSYILDSDDDFNAFLLILSETDHLPLAAQKEFWNTDSLKKLEPDYVRVEKWAATFAVEACERIINRLSNPIARNTAQSD